MELPRKTTLISTEDRCEDDRGAIVSIVDTAVENVSIIWSHAGSIRSNHYHHDDFHFMYVVDGAIDYFYRDVITSDVKYLRVERGENVFTPPNELHATYFPVDTMLIVSSKNPRDQETYERDTHREPLITKANVMEMLRLYAWAK